MDDVAGERRRARLSLGVLILLPTILLLGGGPGSLSGAIAAATGSPTSTPIAHSSSGSASPPVQQTPQSPTVQFINPSKYNSPERISSKEDEGTTFHLVAWTANAPTDAIVEFQYQGTNSTAVTIGNGTAVGGGLYGFSWNTSSVPSGPYTLRARLATGSTLLAEDEEQVAVDNSFETVEITSPTNGVTLPVYDPPGAPQPGFVIETTTSAPINTNQSEAGIRDVRVFYSTSPAGTEPGWRPCNDQRTLRYTDAPQGRQRIGCTLQKPDTYKQLTLIAAAPVHQAAPTQPGAGCIQASPCPAPLTLHAGDAHRVSGSEQTPTTIEFDQSAGGTVGQCLVRTLRVVDQSGNAVWRANVDVHATGPSDQLQFGASSGASAFQAPDTGHTNEPAANCAGGNKDTQGDHEVTNGLDLKHIESTEGSSLLGQFTFAVRNPDSEGTTNYAAWADQDGDDAYTCGEVSGSGSAQWSSPASPSAPIAQPSSPPGDALGGCSSPSPSPTMTQPTADPNVSPSESTASNRQVTIVADKNKVTWRRNVALTGQLTSQDPLCAPSGVDITIERRVFGSDSFRPVTTVSTDVGGNYAAEATVRTTADYRAVAAGNTDCPAVSSDTVTVNVRPKVSAVLTDATLERGAQLSVKGEVRPRHPRSKVLLQRKTSEGWKTVARSRTTERSTFTVTVLASWPGREIELRVRWPRSDEDHAAGTSQKLVLKLN